MLFCVVFVIAFALYLLSFLPDSMDAITSFQPDIGDCLKSYVFIVRCCVLSVFAFALYWSDGDMIEIQGCMIMICYMSLACYICVFRLKPMHLLTFCL